jgi:predicted DNA-binding transcriptional regulator
MQEKNRRIKNILKIISFAQIHCANAFKLCINIKKIKEVQNEFNLLSRIKNQMVNHEGAKAFVMTPEMEHSADSY